MGVIGHWRRSALGAGGVALLLPVGLALGVALTAALGGGNGLHALAQVFSGPSAPGARGGAVAPGLESARDVPPIPLPRVRPVAAPGASGAPAARPRQPPAARPRTPTTVPVRRPTGDGSQPGRRPGGGGTKHPAPSKPPPSPPQHSAVHNAGQQAADAAKGLPGPAGPAAGSAAQTVVDLIP